MITRPEILAAGLCALLLPNCTTWVDHMKIKMDDTTLVNPDIEDIEEIEARESGYFPDENVPDNSGTKKSQAYLGSDGKPIIDAQGNPVQQQQQQQQQPLTPEQKPKAIIRDGTVYYPPAVQQPAPAQGPQHTPNIPAPSKPTTPQMSDPALIEELR